MALIIEAPKSLTRITAAVRREIRLVFFGTPAFAVPALRALHEDGWPVELVVTAPDKLVGRRKLLTPSPVKSAAGELGLSVASPAKLSDEAFQRMFDELRPDLCIVVAYGKIIPLRFLQQARLGFLNIHPSLLPAYRGPSPIQSAILDGCASTGVSIMLLDEQTDHGPVLARESWILPSGFDTPMAEDELSRLGARMLLDVIPRYLDGTLHPQPQQHELATYCAKFTREDGLLDWSQPAHRIVDRIRALGTNPGTWTTWNGRTLNLIHAHLMASTPIPDAPAGTVVLIGTDVAVRCGEGAVGLETIQLEGATRQSVRDFLNGRPSFAGGMLGS